MEVIVPFARHDAHAQAILVAKCIASAAKILEQGQIRCSEPSRQRNSRWAVAEAQAARSRSHLCRKSRAGTQRMGDQPEWAATAQIGDPGEHAAFPDSSPDREPWLAQSYAAIDGNTRARVTQCRQRFQSLSHVPSGRARSELKRTNPGARHQHSQQQETAQSHCCAHPLI